MSKITCPECDGTGSRCPDCWLCDGKRTIKVSHALAEGYAMSDLQNVYEDECDCPTDDCRGDCCELCDGFGEITERQRDDEITRVLVFGVTRDIPPRLTRSHYGRVWESDELLSSFAGGECRAKGWISWYVSVFGDEVNLTPSGEAEALSRMWGWCRQRDAALAPVDDFGRFDDDGGRALSQSSGG